MLYARVSEVSGPGATGFVRSDSARNSIHLVLRMGSGAVVEYATLDDVGVSVMAGSAGISQNSSGGFDVVNVHCGARPYFR